MNSIRKRIFRKTGMVLSLLCMLSLLELFTPEIVKAGVYDNAYTFYQSYGNEMSFRAGKDNQGEIYYATKAKKDENTGIKYTTIGWKVRILNSAGALVETLYYQLGGKNMSSIDTRTENGYEYCLYRVTLANIKSRLSQAGLRALNNPNSNIIFDACTTTKLKGVVQGGMTDSGPRWGTVYTTYNGIVNAEDWSNTTRKTLKSYYNKTVKGLFYNVSIKKGIGISQVSGSGRYCFGTKVTVGAKVLEGYHFSKWTGSVSSSKDTYSFVVYDKNIDLTATAKENTYTFLFEGGEGKGSISPKSIKYKGVLTMPTDGFWKEDASLAGWTTSLKNSVAQYVGGQQLSVATLIKKLGLQYSNGAKITLYATWDHSPLIKTEKIYVSLKDARNGTITEDWLAEKALAYDREDGDIPYGKNKKTSFLMKDYQSTDFTEFCGEGSVTETFRAVDSAGNSTEKIIEVCIVDDQIYPTERIHGKLRFISKRYFMDENKRLINEELGGLLEYSVWRLDEEYRGLLEKLFM